MPSGDESLTITDTIFLHFKQIVAIFSMKVIQSMVRLIVLQTYVLP